MRGSYREDRRDVLATCETVKECTEVMRAYTPDYTLPTQKQLDEIISQMEREIACHKFSISYGDNYREAKSFFWNPCFQHIKTKEKVLLTELIASIYEVYPEGCGSMPERLENAITRVLIEMEGLS